MKAKYIILLLVLVSPGSCNPIDLYEKNVSIPGHEWKSNFKPEFRFEIKDTSALYDVMLVLRHTEKYGYNNIWLNLSMKAPGDSLRSVRVEKVLATNAEGWLGTGMDDIYEHRVSLNKELADNGFSFRRAGEYIFRIEQVMREDPLRHIMNAGLRIEKK